MKSQGTGLEYSPEFLKDRVSTIFDYAWVLRQNKINQNISIASHLGVDEEKLKNLLNQELSEAIELYMSSIRAIIKYENEGITHYSERTSAQYLDLFERADENFDLIISTAYNNRRWVRGYACLEELAIAVEKSLRYKKESIKKII